MTECIANAGADSTDTILCESTKSDDNARRDKRDKRDKCTGPENVLDIFLLTLFGNVFDLSETWNTTDIELRQLSADDLADWEVVE